MSPQSAALHLPRPQLLHRPARRVLTALVAGGVFVTGSGVAFADNVYNTLDPSIDATAEAMSLTAGGAAGTTQLKVDTTNEDGKNGCNLTGSTTLKLALRSSNTDLATVSPAEVIFTSCGDVKDLSVTGLKATGSTPVTNSATQVSNDTGGRFDLAPVTFTVRRRRRRRSGGSGRGHHRPRRSDHRPGRGERHGHLGDRQLHQRHHAHPDGHRRGGQHRAGLRRRDVTGHHDRDVDRDVDVHPRGADWHQPLLYRQGHGRRPTTCPRLQPFSP